MIPMKNLKILLTNDDGAGAKGLCELAAALGELGEVTTVVPELQRSGVGHSMSISNILRVRQTPEGIYLATGFPSDCVKFALCSLMDTPPDIVISGINLGENTGVSVFYSGTVGGAREGALNGITSFAVSVGTDCDPASDDIINAALDVIQVILDSGVPAGSLFNINIPSAQHKGVKFVPQGTGRFKEELVTCTDPRGGEYFWFTGSQDTQGRIDTDTVLFSQGHATVTPLMCDETDHDMIKLINA